MVKKKSRPGGQGRQDVNRQRALARLDALLNEAEALAHKGHTDAALRLLEHNLARFAHYADFQAMVAQYSGDLGDYRKAAEHARLAVDLAPNRTEYRLLAALAYEGAGFHSFAARERRVWLRAGSAGDPRPLMEELEAAFGASLQVLQGAYGLPTVQAAEKAALLLDEGRWALDHGRWADALEHSRAAVALAPTWPAPRNNTALALIYLDRYQEARDEARAVLREEDPDNVHALANLVMTSVTLQEPGEAAAAADRLASLTTLDPETLHKQIQGLAWLDRDADIDRILKAARKRMAISPDLYVHWGIAAANAGRRREAMQRLREAEDAGVRTVLLLETLDALEEKLPGRGISPRYSQTHYIELLPRAAFEEALRLAAEQDKTGYRNPGAWEKLRARYPQLWAGLERMLYEIPDATENVAQLIARVPGPESKEILVRFIGGQAGSDEDRMAILRVMQQAGVIANDEPVQMWLRGARQEVRGRLYDLSNDFGPDYPAEAIRLHERAQAAQAEKQLPEAIRLYRLALQAAPNMKEAYNNLAVALGQQDDTAGALECIDKALAIDPLYPFPLVGRALQALYRDGPAAAKEILAPLADVKRWRPLEMVVYQKGLARVAIEEHDYEAARQALDLASEINPQDPELPHLRGVLEITGALSGLGGRFAEMDESRRQRLRHRGLPADPELADCLGAVSVSDMVGISRALGLWAPSPRKRADVERYLSGNLQEPEVIGRAVGELTEAEQDALRAILAASGVLAWKRFVELFGDEPPDRPALEYHSINMKSVPGRLRARGLIYYGTVDGQESVVIPRELRPLIEEALNA